MKHTLKQLNFALDTLERREEDALIQRCIRERIAAVEGILDIDFNKLIEEVNQEETEEIGHITFAERCFEKLRRIIRG